MPIKPQAMQYQCRQCGWKTCYAPQSDALVELPPERCAQCGSATLDAAPISRMDGLKAAFSALIGKDGEPPQK